jgi:ParB/RepB/Spo0J family partition protein
MAETDVHAEADAATTEVDGRAEFRWVAVGEIHPAEDNLRRELGDLSDLGSVATVGVLEPLLLAPRAAGGYTVVAGHRRHAAAAAAGLAEVPAMVRPYTADQRVEVMLIENLQRRGLSPLEEALGYRRLLDLGLRQRALAERLGVSQSHVSKRLALLSLPPAALEQLDSGGITVTDALDLSKLVDHPARLETAMSQGREWGDVGEAPTYGGWYDRKEKPLDQLRLDPAEHAREKCHAAAVMADGRVVEVCRKPENHASPAAIARMTKETDTQREERAKDKARRDAAKAREGHWRGLVADGALPAEALDFMLGELLRGASSRGSQLAARWLGLEPERDAYGYPRYSAALATYADQGPEQLQRAAFACAVGECEDTFGTRWGAGDPTLRHLTGLLEATGYALTQVELDLVTPREDDDPADALVDGLAREALREGGRGLPDDGEEGLAGDEADQDGEGEG